MTFGRRELLQALLGTAVAGAAGIGAALVADAVQRPGRPAWTVVGIDPAAGPGVSCATLVTFDRPGGPARIEGVFEGPTALQDALRAMDELHGGRAEAPLLRVEAADIFWRDR